MPNVLTPWAVALRLQAIQNKQIPHAHITTIAKTPKIATRLEPNMLKNLPIILILFP